MVKEIKNRKIYFIINPNAGKSKVYLWWEDTIQKLNNYGYDYFWSYTKLGQVSEQIKEAVLQDGAEVIVVVGGDGSLFDALNGLVENDVLIKKDLVFVAFPMGSACDFSRMIYQQDQQDIFELLQKGIIHYIDIGRCIFNDYEKSNGKKSIQKIKYFINSFDVGAGADTCVEINKDLGKRKKILLNGKLAFMITSLQILMTYKYLKISIELESNIMEGEYIIIGFGNGIFAGGGMKLFPHAKIDDGLLDLLLIPRMNRLKILWLFSKVYNGNLIDIINVKYLQVRMVRIRTEKPIFFEMDGEIPGKTDVELSVLKGFLPILVFP